MSRGRALLRPRDADRARPGRRTSASRARSRAPTTSSTSAASSHDDADGEARHGDRAAAEITARLVRGRARRAYQRVAQGEPLRRSASRSASTRTMDDPIFALRRCATSRGTTVFATSTHFDRRERTGSSRPARRVVCASASTMRLAASRYTLSPSVARAGRGRDVVDVREDLASLSCTRTRITGGVVDLAAAHRRSSAMTHRHAPAQRPRDPRRRRAPLLARSPGRSRSPTGSCASTAACSATCGRSRARSCSSA